MAANTRIRHVKWRVSCVAMTTQKRPPPSSSLAQPSGWPVTVSGFHSAKKNSRKKKLKYKIRPRGFSPGFSFELFLSLSLSPRTSISWHVNKVAAVVYWWVSWMWNRRNHRISFNEITPLSLSLSLSGGKPPRKMLRFSVFSANSRRVGDANPPGKSTSRSLGKFTRSANNWK